MNNTRLIVFVFIDYDNLHPRRKSAGILDLLSNIFVQIPWDPATTLGICETRVYGGWYEGDQITQKAQKITVELGRDFPTIIRIPRKNARTIALTVRVELALALLQDPGHHLLNTYRRKGKPSNLRVKKPDEVGCVDSACILLNFKELLKHGSCPKPGCTVTSSDLIYRNEQKIVDTMLTCDLIYAADFATGPIILVSSDDDFLPPLRTILLRDASVVRCHTSASTQRIKLPISSNHKLLELEI